MRDIITRFAPAPTGFLHLGHVLNAMYVWGIAWCPTTSAAGRSSRVLLRIEDHDRQRSRPEFERAILEDLEWLGFVADGAAVRQSERGPIYARALDRLRAQGLVYACECSRADAGPGRYPGTCRARGLEDAPGRTLRVRMDAGVERFDDLRHGPQVQQPWDQCGDVVVRDRDGNWTYQFAAAVDDLTQQVTLVIRGDDLLESTGRQLRLARLLGRTEPPRFLHHPLIMKSATQKLSKSDRATGVRDLRAHGWTPQRVLGEAAFLANLTRERGEMTWDDLRSTMCTFSEVKR
jgi:glutamyl-tRNA synthetase/glutamyl-Q tRNA(Asp) synthetase